MLPLYMPMSVACGLPSHLLLSPAKVGPTSVSCMPMPNLSDVHD